MRLVTVGTGTVVPHPERGSACHWVEEGPTRVLMDCGAGGLHGLARAGLDWGRVSHLLISHFHADHIAEIPSLIFALRHGLEVPRGDLLEIYGPRGTRAVFDGFTQAYGAWITDPGFGLSIHELEPGASGRLDRLELRVGKTEHTDESLAFRIESGDVALGYTGDTGPADGLAEFFRDVDLLLAECSLPEALVSDNHLSPERLGRLAAASNARRLAVTHVYPQLASVDIPSLIRKEGYAGEIVLASDGMEFRI